MEQNELHTVGAVAGTHEAVCEKFLLDGLLGARQKTILVVSEIRHAMREGMTEDDARRVGMDIFASHGVTKHWHKVYVRFGPGTALTFHDPLQNDYRLQQNDPFYIDVGPVWKDTSTGIEYEGDYGDTFVFGEDNDEARTCIVAARRLFTEGRELWSSKCVSGSELYAHMSAKARDWGYELVNGVDGHRIGDFPHHKYSKERLARLGETPTANRWVLEVLLRHSSGKMGAFFEDIL